MIDLLERPAYGRMVVNEMNGSVSVNEAPTPCRWLRHG